MNESWADATDSPTATQAETDLPPGFEHTTVSTNSLPCYNQEPAGISFTDCEYVLQSTSKMMTLATGC